MKESESPTELEAFEALEVKIAKRRAEMSEPALLSHAKNWIRMPEIEKLDWRGAPSAPICDACSDMGWVITPDEGAGTAERCECQQKRYDGPESIPASDLEIYGCSKTVARKPKSKWDPQLGTWPPMADKWPKDVRDSEGNRPKWLYVHGDTGNGKSLVAAWIMRRFMAEGVSCWWIDVPMAINSAKQAIGQQAKQETFDAQMGARLKRKLVILDECGGHKGSEYETNDLVGPWVQERHESGLWTVGTGNKDEKALSKFYPAHTASRVMSGPVINMTGGDARRRDWRIA